MMTSGYNIMDLIREAHIRWLKPGEVLFILQHFEESQLTHEPPQKPPSGSLFLFNKRVLRFFRKDGHSWRRKKDGRNVGEAHERLKVGNVEALNCYYAHGEVNPNFQRRSYWMLDPSMDHIVLVHYRDITMGGHSAGPISTVSTGSSTLIQSSNSYVTQFTQSAAAFSQFREPYESTSSPGSVEVSSDVVIKSNGTSPLTLAEVTEEIGGSPNFEIDQALQRIREQLSLDEDNLKDIGAFYSENEISNESGITVNEQDYGGSGGMHDGSINYTSEQYPGEYGTAHQYQQQSEGEFSITSQQTSIWDDVLIYNGNAVGDGSQKNFVYPSDRNGVLLPQPRRDPVEEQEKYNYGYTSANNDSSILLPHELEDFKFPAYTPARNLSDSYPDFYSTMFGQGQGGMPLESASSLTIAQEQKFTIREIAPQWGYASEPTKDESAVPALSKREQGIIHMVSGLGFGWALTPILNSGVGVNFRDINGWTALHWAARFGREKMVAELLASGASAGAVTDPSQLDPTGKTPASIAATCGHKGLAGYLSEVSLTSHPTLKLQQSELSRNSADLEAERTVDSISKLNLVSDEDPSLRDTLAAVRNTAQAAARIQSAFRAHSFRKRQQKESTRYATGDEYGILPSDIEGLSAASKLTFRNGNDHNAALSIQKKYRGWKGRKDFLALRQKVVKIQAHVRGHQVRKNYKVFCWAVGVVEKVVLRWRRKGVGLRGFKQELGTLDDGEDEDIVKVFRKQNVDVSIDEAVSRVLSMVDSQQARQQYRRMLQKYRQAKAEHERLESEAASTSENEELNKFIM
ncbi:calmodulin-binding transcription activator 4 isoform X4 [Cynara cardunculus var. scolymus]|uniref:calmodulin-binding transcription activator 4 isoform X4 n=1 Tax=Cynara cardunculus var. scolymus TaxID=59895 RepID=UPI000D62498E|nr:calmodulin-binding transcription activator 4 isoform X4 [Cynara cardunculus var. scolymus]